jgi:thioredoxin-dependent adenylylsulfate APS reductase
MQNHTQRSAATVTAATRPLLAQHDVARAAAELESATPQDILWWGIKRFGARLALCTSLQADGMALLDMAVRIAPRVRVFTIDSGRLPAETYDLIDRVRERYGSAIEVYAPDAAELGAFVSAEGVNPFYRSTALRLECCRIRKVNPLERVLRDLDAWVTGLRRDQSANRADTRVVEVDEQHGGIVKLNPLAAWSEAQVWDYIRANDVPYNALYDQGYTSIGCAPCTRAIQPGEDPRAGRWWWETDTLKECGMHCSLESGSLARRAAASAARLPVSAGGASAP